MYSQEILERYVSICQSNLESNPRALSFLKRNGITEGFIFENFRVGYASGNLVEILGENDELIATLGNMGILNGKNEALKGCITIPVLNENKAIENVVGYKLYARSGSRTLSVNEQGIFNAAFIRNVAEVFVTEGPIDALFFIQNDYPNITFTHGQEDKFIRFLHGSLVRRIVFTFDGKARLFHELSKNGVSTESDHGI